MNIFIKLTIICFFIFFYPSTALSVNQDYDKESSLKSNGETDVVQNGGFELGVPNSYWEASTVLFANAIYGRGCIYLDENYCDKKLEARTGEYVLLTITDTGCGMDKETVQHIFEPFFTTKEIGKGTGLGMASVYGIVKNHGGYISCYSEIGHGTTFKIYFPAVNSNEEIKETRKNIKLPEGGTETVLVVDDEEFIRELAEQILKKYGYNVITADSGEKAVTLYSDIKNIDLVLLDIGMPGMGGYKCLSELLRIDINARVIVASGYSMDKEIKKSLDSGAAGFIGKPYQLNDLLLKVREILDKETGSAD